MSIIPALGSLRQEDSKSEASQIQKLCFKEKAPKKELCIDCSFHIENCTSIIFMTQSLTSFKYLHLRVVFPDFFMKIFTAPLRL
jgi:hypothetical protein